MNGLPKKRVAVLISGRGSNMKTLAEAAGGARSSYEIVGVIADVADAAGLNHAAALDIEARALPRKDYSDKATHEAAIDAQLKSWNVEIVALAGYMRLLSPEFVGKWTGRMINIHPSLLPLFKGLDTHKRALDAGMRVHGCTVHFVTAEMDDGPIVAQAAVPVLPDDNEESLTRRVLAAEHQLYPLALDLVATGRAQLVGNRVAYDNLGTSGGRGIVLSPAVGGDEPDLESLARFTP
ncbi:phosphoribosylglycinamide formyltransferase [Aliihoeflea aestuarii]|uniref:phosphoribosylglycinamide formyltransferase n=1 Tax=Aliihoeflea aestuarii TaxID=453840 RepID=UPI0020958F54|nr:phosphoribosylglycinamide formyltransferase [Aliihoeflea aestuarii]MCO6392741.1 phosphoribosylglycinamide formyltransferase [Aliihoeflea aestuarii]